MDLTKKSTVLSKWAFLQHVRGTLRNYSLQNLCEKKKIVFFHTAVTVWIVLNYDRRGQERYQQMWYLAWMKIFFADMVCDILGMTVEWWLFHHWCPRWPLGPGLCSKKHRERCVASLLSLVSREVGEKDVPLEPVFSSASKELQETERDRDTHREKFNKLAT